MKIVVLGKGKSGTTALLHMIAAAFPECRPVLGGLRAHIRDRARPGADPDDSYACKFTFNDRKGRSFDAMMRHVEDDAYDRKIWVARDPRDNAVSDALYRWRRRHGKSRRQFRPCLAAVERKERDPRSVPFHEIYRFTGDPGGPETLPELVASERARYDAMCAFVGGLGSDWFTFRYEDLVDGNFGPLSDYLGRPISAVARMPRDDQVKVRTKGYGDWRNWFLPEDVEVFEPIYTPYMEMVGYDTSDWALAPNPTIDPTLASEYMKRLDGDGYGNSWQDVKKRIRRFYRGTVERVSQRSP